MGGEEFCVFVPGSLPDGAVVVAERIRRNVKAADFCPGGLRYDLSVSIGLATFVHRMSFSELYKLADRRLYTAKRNGRNRVELSELGSTSHLAAVN